MGPKLADGPLIHVDVASGNGARAEDAHVRYENDTALDAPAEGRLEAFSRHGKGGSSQSSACTRQRFGSPTLGQTPTPKPVKRRRHRLASGRKGLPLSEDANRCSPAACGASRMSERNSETQDDGLMHTATFSNRLGLGGGVDAAHEVHEDTVQGGRVSELLEDNARLTSNVVALARQVAFVVFCISLIRDVSSYMRCG
jgi:hypothetical protein